MNTNTNKLRSFVVLGLLILIFLEICAVFSAPVKYVPYNVVFYYILVYFTMRNLFSERPHHICAFLWSLMTADLLGWFWGALTVILYWVLYFTKMKIASVHKKVRREEEDDENEDEAGEEDSSKVPSFITKNGYELLQTIQPIFRIPFFGIPKIWHKYHVVKRGKTYLLLNRPFFFFFTKTTDLCSLHRPDLVKEWLQIFNMAEIVIFSDEDKSRLIKIWVAKKVALPTLSDLLDNITDACDENKVKRIVGETAPHQKK